MKTTLHQLVRDWSEEGQAERDACYAPLLAELGRHLPVTDATRNRQRVLVPGCGLGRLPFDLALRGYAAQGNEFAYFMLFASHFVLNCTADDGGGGGGPHPTVVLYPWIHDPSNHLRPQDMLRAVPVPDVDPNSLLTLNPGADLSMVAGDFLEVYGGAQHVGAWDAVVTCFFIDTAPVVFDYIDLIWRLLRPGGVWVNLGPLLFHWAELPRGEEGAGDDEGAGAGAGVDSRYLQSVELSYQEVRHAVVAQGFTIAHEAIHRSPYASNRLSLMKTVYSATAFTALKPSSSPQQPSAEGERGGKEPTGT